MSFSCDFRMRSAYRDIRSAASPGDISQKKQYHIGTDILNCSLSRLVSSRDRIKFGLNIIQLPVF